MKKMIYGMATFAVAGMFFVPQALAAFKDGDLTKTPQEKTRQLKASQPEAGSELSDKLSDTDEAFQASIERAAAEGTPLREILWTASYDGHSISDIIRIMVKAGIDPGSVVKVAIAEGFSPRKVVKAAVATGVEVRIVVIAAHDAGAKDAEIAQGAKDGSLVAKNPNPNINVEIAVALEEAGRGKDEFAFSPGGNEQGQIPEGFKRNEKAMNSWTMGLGGAPPSTMISSPSMP